MMDGRVRIASRLLALGGLAVLLVGCESIREAAGITKEPPDEFAVVTKAPLVIPPDFNLKPPKPGASPTNQISPTTSAQAALYGDDPNVIAAGISGGYSQAEKLLLAKSGGAVADAGIRQQIAAENKRMEAADESFTDKVLFGSDDNAAQGKAVNADAEAKRLSDAKAGEKPASVPGATSQPDQPAQEKPDDSATIQKDENSGWFGDIFGGIF